MPNADGSKPRILDGIAAETKRRGYKECDLSAIDAVDWSVLRHYGTRQRVKVTTVYDNGETFTRTGFVSRTTGWKPALLLMHRSNASGSWDVLGPRDRVVAVQYRDRDPYVVTMKCEGRTGHKDPRCGRVYGHDGVCDWTD